MVSFVPVISSAAGSSLTMSDWENIGVTTVSVSLEHLLIKPGIDALLSCSSIQAYLGKPQRVVLNASMISFHHAHKTYALVSPYDGRRITLTEHELISLLRHLKPDYLLLSSADAVSQLMDVCQKIYIPISSWRKDLASQCGIWLDQISALETYDFSDDPSISCYFRLNQFVPQTLINENLNIEWIESDMPANDARSGLVYHSGKNHIDIKSSACATCFSVLSQDCLCEACQLGLTQAYFHHLFVQTPGLCQRFLVQHNAAIFASKCSFYTQLCCAPEI